MNESLFANSSVSNILKEQLGRNLVAELGLLGEFVDPAGDGVSVLHNSSTALKTQSEKPAKTERNFLSAARRIPVENGWFDAGQLGDPAPVDKAQQTKGIFSRTD